jgi:serine/threonine-protein kinase
MGVVLRGHDACLNRELAVKVLHPQLRDAPAIVRRFTDEAQIGGRLQHPGVVPVYDLGILPDGCLFFAMKLVEGRTLSDLLKERPVLTHDLPRFLKVFEQVCQTMAYAHSRRVLHRDLKPANVMVGAFGEVQLMDWGLAKVLASGETSSLPTVLPSGERRKRRSPGTAEQTQEGSVMGTFAYMAPEQARGEIHHLDERADVFGLGAILCEVLTGKPPYTASSPDDVAGLAEDADLSGAWKRLDSCGADPELLALAKGCLAPCAEDRPRDAGAVAAAVTAYLTGVQERLRRAELERAEAQVKAAEERKRRRIALALAGAVLLALLAGGGAYTVARQQRQQRQEQTALLLNQALGQATALRDLARAAPINEAPQRERAAALWRDALAAAERAEQALDSGSADADTRDRAAGEIASFRSEAAQAERDRRMLQRLEDARDKAMDLQESDYVRQHRVQEFVFGLAAAPVYAAAFRDYGIDVEALSTRAAAARIAESALRLRLAIALDVWYFLDPGAAGGRLLEVARAADPDPLRERVRVAIASKDRKALKELAESKPVDTLPAPTLILLADVLHQQGLRAEGLALMKRAQGLHPDDFWVNDVLGLHLNATDPPDHAAACLCYAAALALRPDRALVWSNLGNALQLQGRTDQAVLALSRALQVDPRFAATYPLLAFCLVQQDKSDEALDVLRQGLRLRPDSPMLLTALGEVLNSRGKREESRVTFRKVLARNPDWVFARLRLAQALVQGGPNKEAMELLEQALRSHAEMPQVHALRGAVLLNLGEREGAIRAYRKAVELDPALADNWSSLGYVLALVQRHEEALLAYAKAVTIAPASGPARAALAGALRFKGRREEAEAECREAIRLSPNHAPAHAELGLALTAQGKFVEASAALRRAIQLQPGNAWYYSYLGDTLPQQKDVEGAVAAYHKAIGLKPDEGVFYNHLANALWNDGRHEEAVPYYRLAVKQTPTNADFQMNLGNALSQTGDPTGALKPLKKSLELASRYGLARANLSVALLRVGQVDEAVAAAQEAVRLEPNSFFAHGTLATALERKGRFDEAIDEYRAAVRLNPRQAEPHSQLSGALYRRSRFLEAVTAAQEVTRLRPDWADAHAWLGDNLFALRRFNEAVKAYGRAVELEPNSARRRGYLALAYSQRGDSRRAEAEARKAIEIAPREPQGYLMLGQLLAGRGKLQEAVVQYREGIALDSRNAAAIFFLGGLLVRQGKHDEAEATFRKALELSPKLVPPRVELAALLLHKGNVAEAEKEMRRAVAELPEFAGVHAWLALALLKQGKLNEALVAAQKAVSLQAAYAPADFALGEVLLARGDFAGALGAFQHASRLPPGMDIAAAELLPLDERVQTSKRALALDATLEGLRRGKVKVIDAEELAALARFCHERKSDAAFALKLYGDAFATAPKLVDDLNAGHRLGAARASLAASRKVGEPEATRLRQQALDWLRADLVAWTKKGDGAAAERTAARQQLLRWREDIDLAEVRNPEALTRLLQDERTGWQKLWSDVDKLVERLRGESGSR